MDIRFNGKTVRIFRGATVGDALLRFSEELHHQAEAGQKKILDRHGHEVALSGELTGGEAFRIA